jgi:integrase
MGRVNLRYVSSWPDRHGKLRTYFRIRGKRYALSNPGSPTFSEEYQEMLAKHAPAEAIKRQGRGGEPVEGTLEWVILEYKNGSAQWAAAADSTKDVYNRRFDWLNARYGTADLSSFTEKGIRKIRNKLKKHPSVADAVVDMIGRLWLYSKEHLDMDDLGPNPAAEVASIHTEHESAPAWPEELCQKYEALTDRPRLRRAYYLLRYSGQRRSDIVKMHRKQYDGTAIEVVQQKTGTYVWVPAHKLLRDHLAATGIDGDYLLTSSRGGRFAATSITNMICDQCAEFGFPGYSPHGLRHLAGAALAEAGATIEQIKSILGHKTDDEARKYVQQARRKVMAADGMRLWEKAANDR